MSLIAHLSTLKLKKTIEDAYSHHVPDLTVMDLKKEKLRVKEEILKIEQQLASSQKRQPSNNNKKMAA
jgi:hypothetical protein